MISRTILSEPYGEMSHTLEVELSYTQTASQRGLWVSGNIVEHRNGMCFVTPSDGVRTKVLDMKRFSQKTMDSFVVPQNIIDAVRERVLDKTHIVPVGMAVKVA